MERRPPGPRSTNSLATKPSPLGNAPLRAHIDSIVLKGFPKLDTNSLQHAFQKELQMLIARARPKANLQATGSIERLDCKPLHLPSNVSPKALGQEIARAIFAQFFSTGGAQR